MALALPAAEGPEGIVDRMAMLHGRLRRTSGHRGRRLKRFDPRRQALRLGQPIEDYSALRGLTTIRRLEAQARVFCADETGRDT